MLQDNTVICGDVFQNLSKLPSGAFDLIVTDPPYACDYGNKSTRLNKLEEGEGGSRSTVERDALFQQDVDFNYYYFLEQLHRVMKMDSHCYIFCANKQLIKYMTYTGKLFNGHDFLIWLKNGQGFDPSGYNYNCSTENVLFLRKGSRKLNKIGLNNVLRFDREKGGYLHPTQKPVELIRSLILNSSDEGELVFDPFMGSGTTAIACIRSKRRFFGFELVPEYHQVIMNRIKENKSNGTLDEYYS